MKRSDSYFENVPVFMENNACNIKKSTKKLYKTLVLTAQSYLN